MKKTKMTIEEFRAQVDAVHMHEGDWEVTHSMTDGLMEEIVQGLLNDVYTKKELKQFAVMLQELNGYPRWYA